MKQMIKFFEEFVNALCKKGVYCDALIVDKSKIFISKDSKTIDFDDGADFGVKVRIYNNNSFQEYCTSEFDEENIKKNVLKLIKNMKVFKPKKNLNCSQKRERKDFKAKQKKDFTKIPVSEKIKRCNDIYSVFSHYADFIINTRIVYIEFNEKKAFIGPNKTYIQHIPGCRLVMMPMVKSPSGDIRYHFKSIYRSGYEVMDIKKKEVKAVAEFALRIKDAKRIKPGKYKAVLSPEVSGLLAHESFGHGMESDTIYKERALAKQWLGKRIASKDVSIIDNPALEGRNGSFFFDDEGKLAEPTYLVKKGIVNDPITDMYSATKLDIKRTANGRAQSFDHKAYARMSNTYFEKGKSSLTSIMKKVNNGLYLHYSSGGMEDPKGWGVQVQGIVAEKIKNGKLTGELFYEIGLSGYLPDILDNIVAVGNQLHVEGAGFCGKGHKEWVRVSEGGSHLLIKNLELS